MTEVWQNHSRTRAKLWQDCSRTMRVEGWQNCSRRVANVQQNCSRRVTDVHTLSCSHCSAGSSTSNSDSGKGKPVFHISRMVKSCLHLANRYSISPCNAPQPSQYRSLSQDMQVFGRFSKSVRVDRILTELIRRKQHCLDLTCT